MPAVSIVCELAQIVYDGRKWIQVDVSNELQEVGLVLAQDRLEPILEQVPGPVMATIEVRRITGEQRSHRATQRLCNRPEQEMHVVRHQSPRVHVDRASLDEQADATEKIFAIRVIDEDRATFDTARDDVVKRAGRVESRAARH